MNQFEKNVVQSFRLAKNDIIRLQNKLIEVSQNQQKLVEQIDSLRTKEALMSQKLRELTLGRLSTGVQKTVVKSAAKSAKKVYVASKEGKKFHVNNCPFAQNIKPKTKITFTSKTEALNKGYKPCHCIQ